MVAVQDAGGNTVTTSSASVAMSINTGTGTLSGTTSVNASSGIAIFSNLLLDKATIYTLKATSGTLTSATTGNIVISVGAATKLAITTQPTAPSTNGGALNAQPVVVVQDAGGNTVTTSTASITATPIAGSGVTWRIGGINLINAVNGIATFSGLTAASDDAVTGATITFSSTGLTSATSNTFNIPAPTYQSQWISANVGASTWCPGDTRNITVTVKNIGTATWSNATTPAGMNVGVKWDEDADYGNTIPRISVESGSPAGPVAPGQTVTYTFTGVAPSTKQGANHLTFDIVREGKCWFAGGCDASNITFVSPVYITAPPTITSVTGTPSTICNGSSSNLVVTAPASSAITIVNYDFNSGTSFGTLTPALATGISSTASGTATFATATGNVTTATTPASFMANINNDYSGKALSGA